MYIYLYMFPCLKVALVVKQKKFRQMASLQITSTLDDPVISYNRTRLVRIRKVILR